MLRGFLGQPWYSEQLEADKGGNPAGGTTTQDPPTTGGEPGKETQTGETEGQPGATAGEGKTKTFNQDQVNAAVAEERRKTEARMNRLAEERAAEEKQEFEKLAKERGKRITEIEPELETTKAERDEAWEILEGQYKDRLKKLPSEVQDMAPEGNLKARMTWIAKAEKAAEKLASGRPLGTSPGPRSTGSADPAADLVQREKERLLSSGQYTPL